METAEEESTRAMPVSKFIELICDKLRKHKHADGTMKGSFENYYKCDKRLAEFCKMRHIDYPNLRISEVTPSFIESVLEWVINNRKGKGLSYISKGLHAIIMRADKEGLLNYEDFKRCSWYKAPMVTSQKFNTLTDEQIKKFRELDLFEINRSRNNELYRDFCLFILHTGQSPCDALTLRYSDIERINGVSHFVFKRRKIAHKQAVPCSVPISDELSRIMEKYRKRSKDGYIFPVRTKKKIATQGTNNGDIKHFIGNLNSWLKKIGEELRCKFPLHSYTFRHTAITRYISKGVPVVYVANMMGTSVENCEKIYYNNNADVASRNKVLQVMMGL